MELPTISIAVCTRDRTIQLDRLLKSLEDQSIRPAQIIVVDNAPADSATRNLIEQHYRESVEYCCEPVAGLDFARNRALHAVSTDVVAFIDDDAVPDTHWLERLRAAFIGDALVSICTGRVEALSLATAGPRLFEANGGFDRGQQGRRLGGLQPASAWKPRRPLIAWSFGLGVGCSMAVRTRVALEIGGFDNALDMGQAMPGGGDTDLIWRVLRAGYAVRYEPEARVYHEHRATRADAIRQIVGHNKASMAMLGKSLMSASGTERLSTGVYILWRLLKPGVRLVRRMIGRDPLPARVLLTIWLACWQGLFSYPKAQRTARARIRAITDASAAGLPGQLQPSAAASAADATA